MAKKLLINTLMNAFTDETGKIAKTKVFQHALNGGLMLSTYNNYKDEGKGTLTALADTAVDWSLMPILGFWGFAGLEAVKNAGAIVDGVESLGMQQRAWMRQTQNQMPFNAHTFVDGQQIYTMRQAGMALAQKAKYQVQAAQMGNEAQFMHR